MAKGLAKAAIWVTLSYSGFLRVLGKRNGWWSSAFVGSTLIDTARRPIVVSSHWSCGRMSMSLKSPLTKFIGVDKSPHRIRPARVPFREPENRATSARLGVKNVTHISVYMHLIWLGIVGRSVSADSWSLSWIKRRTRSAVSVSPTFSFSDWYSSLECKKVYHPPYSEVILSWIFAYLQ